MILFYYEAGQLARVTEEAQYSLYYYNMITFSISYIGRLRGLAVAFWTTDHYHPCSNLGVGTSEGCFIFDFAPLPLEVARPICLPCAQTGRKRSIIINMMSFYKHIKRFPKFFLLQRVYFT